MPKARPCFIDWESVGLGGYTGVDAMNRVPYIRFVERMSCGWHVPKARPYKCVGIRRLFAYEKENLTEDVGGGEAEFLVKNLVGSGSAEAFHAVDSSAGADNFA